MLKIAYKPNYCHPLPESHRFPMLKYELIPEQLLYEHSITEANLFAPTPLSEAEVLRTHSAAYVQQLRTASLERRAERRLGFPLSQALYQRELDICGGTWQLCQAAQQYGVAMNVSGGTHHAYYDRGEGFCLLNDLAMAARLLLDSGRARQILIIDLDVHQGNGTAALFAGESRVFTFSMHGAANYPHPKEHGDLDLALPRCTEDGPYMRLLADTLPRLIDELEPDFAFYQAGVDVLATDKLGTLALSLAGCHQRDRYVYQQLKQNAIPVVTVMGGGYSPRLRDIVQAHCNTYRAALEVFF
ncbi:MAG: histone deacetylase [Bacteroidetes bacterium]|jgi:acetoin utilization deacetylase AcuC-like enzyme|nr:histone deacetylase [Bacteroidota bacterium]